MLLCTLGSQPWELAFALYLTRESWQNILLFSGIYYQDCYLVCSDICLCLLVICCCLQLKVVLRLSASPGKQCMNGSGTWRLHQNASPSIFCFGVYLTEICLGINRSFLSEWFDSCFKDTMTIVYKMSLYKMKYIYFCVNTCVIINMLK